MSECGVVRRSEIGACSGMGSGSRIVSKAGCEDEISVGIEDGTAGTLEKDALDSTTGSVSIEMLGNADADFISVSRVGCDSKTDVTA